MLLTYLQLVQIHYVCRFVFQVHICSEVFRQSSRNWQVRCHYLRGSLQASASKDRWEAGTRKRKAGLQMLQEDDDEAMEMLSEVGSKCLFLPSYYNLLEYFFQAMLPPPGPVVEPAEVSTGSVPPASKSSTTTSQVQTVSTNGNLMGELQGFHQLAGTMLVESQE